MKKISKAPIKKLSLKIGNKTVSFEADIFDLEIHNIGLLNEQIAAIPGHIAWVGSLIGEADSYYESVKTARDVWLSEIRIQYHDEKSEKAKIDRVIHDYGDDYQKWESTVIEAGRVVSLLESYKKGLEAKFALSQTISANIRLERESAYYKGQKGARSSL